MERISSISQLIAEAKFVEAQQNLEQLLNDKLNSQEYEKILELYFETLTAQNKSYPTERLLKLIEIKVENDSSNVEHWLNQIKNPEKEKYQYEIYLIKINYFEKRGRLNDLYNSIRDFQNYLYEFRIPNSPNNIVNLIQKFFPSDFHLQTQALALDLLRMDLYAAEEKTKELILKAVMGQNPREANSKLKLITTVLNSLPIIHQLDIYRNLCLLLSSGIQTKKDFKKIIECIIFFEDYRILLIILNFLNSLKFEDCVISLVDVIKKNPDYNFVFVSKYFPELKYLFIKSKIQKPAEVKALEVDLELQTKLEPIESIDFQEVDQEVIDHEVILSKLIRIQEFDSNTLLDLAINFIQSDFLKTAIESIQLVLNNENDIKIKLKAYYLLVTAYLKAGDFRAALDICLTAMEMAESQNDILSFLYGQAEAYLKLKDNKSAKAVLEKIMAIDGNYRLAKDKLERLNAI